VTAPGVCILAAPGPSLPSARLGDRGHLPDILAVTSAFLAVPRARHVYAADRPWWVAYGERVTAMHPEAQRWMPRDNRGAVDGCTPLEIDIGAPGLSRVPGKVHRGGNSGYQALNLAVLLGYTTLLLVGYDMRRVDGRQHFFGPYPEQHLDRESPYHDWVAAFRTVAMDGFRVVNCTPGSAIDAFPFGELEAYL
jgi:hypothetical protein